MHPSKEVIILLSLVIECPAAIKKVALVAGVSECYGEASLGQRGKVLEVRINFREAEAAAEAAISNEQETSVPWGRQAQLKVPVTSTTIHGGYVAQPVAVGDRVRLWCSRYDCRIERKDRLNGGLRTVHGR